MFFLHEKGTRMGVNSFLLVVAPYIGQSQIRYVPWRLSNKSQVALPAGLFSKIQNLDGDGPCTSLQSATQFSSLPSSSLVCYPSLHPYSPIIGVLTHPVPETIYERDVAAVEAPEKKRTIWRRLGFRTPTNPTGETWIQTFKRPYTMFVYPAVILPSFWVSVAVMTEVANTAGFALNFGATSRFHFNTAQVGFCFFSGLIGAMLGEFCAGPLCDLVVKRTLRKQQEWQAEKILKLSITGLVTIMVRLRPPPRGNNSLPP